ncbi:MAG: asparagine synthase (glutamine-hydrolyzing) [Nocardioidaceae bacterium]
MCGIAGLAGRLACGPPQERDDRVARGLDALRHRGPDGGGVWSSAELPVTLGHRRLSIIDLTSAAMQPMTIESGRHAVTYNGEVYNFTELRGRLERGGCRLRTRSDTEVLLLACRMWGPLEAVRRAQGMFAFAYLDGPSRQLWLIRDRFGEKPLYWTLLDGTVIFASELKALVAVSGVRPAVDRQSLATFLARGAVAQPASIYDGVQQVPAGTALRIQVTDAITQQDIARHIHWDAVGEARHAAESPFPGTLDDAAAVVDAELRRSVRASTVADRPVGAFLSGGVDSTLVTALMRDASEQPVRTFTVGFDDPRYNEAAYAASVASHLGTKHTEVTLSAQDVLAVVPSLPRMYDEPFADPSQLPTHLVARVAHEDVAVALSGDAGDELFGGYNRHISAQRLYGRLARVPRGMRGLAGRAASRLSPAAWDAIGRSVGMQSPTGGLGARVHKLAPIADFHQAADLYDKLVSSTRRRYVLGGAAPRPARLPEAGGLVGSMMLADTLGYLTDDILVKVDRAAMATSLETRIPMLDPEVYRLAWSLPLEHKVSGGVGKLVLRRLLASLLPVELMDRAKTGFDLPLGDWLRGPLRRWADDLLDPETLRRQGYLDVPQVRTVWDRHVGGRSSHTAELWNLLMYQAWLAEWGGAR